MARTKSATATPDAAVIYEAATAFAFTGPGASYPIVVRAGDQLRGDHPIVLSQEGMFFRVGDEPGRRRTRRSCWPIAGTARRWRDAQDHRPAL